MIKSENLASQIFIQKLELLFIPQGHPVPRKATIKYSSLLKSEVSHVFSSPFVISDNNWLFTISGISTNMPPLFSSFWGIFQQYLTSFLSNFGLPNNIFFISTFIPSRNSSGVSKCDPPRKQTLISFY